MYTGTLQVKAHSELSNIYQTENDIPQRLLLN